MTGNVKIEICRICPEDPIDRTGMNEYDGICFETGQSQYVRYEEVISQEEGDIVSQCLLRIEKNKVYLTRKGEYSTKMEWVQNQESLMEYKTPYGNTNISIYTSKVRVMQSENQIKVAITYIQDSLIQLKITIDKAI